jgi:hypothetical protein
MATTDFLLKQSTTNNRHVHTHKNPSQSPLDYINFIDDVRSIDFENLVSVENVDEAYSNFQSAFTEVIDKHKSLRVMVQQFL